MALTIEWHRRIDAWRKTLHDLVYLKLGDLAVEGFFTGDRLTPEQAAASDAFRAMPHGTRWDTEGQYAWFRTRLTVPSEADGQHLVLCLGTDREGIIWANGRVVGARPGSQTLAWSAEAGAEIDILHEAYKGYRWPHPHRGPIAADQPLHPEPEPATLQATHFGIHDEDVFQLMMDVETLWQTRENIDENCQRQVAIDDALMEMTCIVELEDTRERLLETAREARRRLGPLMKATNGTEQGRFFCVGHGHLDVAWLWPLEETERKTARTIGNQLTLAERYPEHRFIWSQPHLYRMMQEHYPDLYERLKRAVADGQIIADGGMWVEADTNITGGESLIRQFIHGKRFFRDEFGVDSRLLWLPDVFGYSAALPQIMRGCEVEYFFTTKIFWNHSGGEDFPYSTFTWQGLDGSQVRATMWPVYNQPPGPHQILAHWNKRRQRNEIDSALLPYGWGDGGGGPDREHVEYLRRLEDFQGVPRCRQAHPMEFFEDRARRGWPEVHYVGELYLQLHRGTFTSQGRTKRANRKTELALREAEHWAALAVAVGDGFDYPLARLDKAWKRVLLNQFHDVLPGSSIGRVYDEALELYEASSEDACAVSRDATDALVGTASGDDSADDLVAMNSLSWPRTEVVLLPEGWPAAAGPDGTPLPVQTCPKTGKAWAEVTIPACGWTTLKRAGATPETDAGALRVERRVIENAHLRAEFNEFGALTSAYDKDAGRELLRGHGNAFRMYRDVPIHWDAWDIESMYRRTPVELAEPAEITVGWTGPLEVALKITRRLHGSTMKQYVSLRRDARQLVFQTEVDWHERHKLLKVEFDLDVHADEAIHEIQFGHVRRPNHYSRRYDADRFEVPCQKWTALMETARGAAVLNDCKYGVNVHEGTIALTLLRAPLAPDPEADQGQHTFTYALTFWNAAFAESPLVRQGYELNVPPLLRRGTPAEPTASLIEVEGDNVVLETVKAAEDGSGDLVLRLYEAKRTASRATIRLAAPLAEARATNMLEDGGELLTVAEDGTIELAFRAFEIKTLRLRMKR